MLNNNLIDLGNKTIIVAWGFVVIHETHGKQKQDKLLLGSAVEQVFKADNCTALLTNLNARSSHVE